MSKLIREIFNKRNKAFNEKYNLENKREYDKSS